MENLKFATLDQCATVGALIDAAKTALHLITDGSERGDIRVGCHNIDFEELEKMAVILGYIENANA